MMKDYKRFIRFISLVISVFAMISAGNIVSAAGENYLRRGQETVIDYGKQYSALVDCKEKAAGAIREYGIRMRALYDNPEVEVSELRMEQEYGILAVNLGEMDEQTAEDIEAAFSYMYQRYPVLSGTLTNLTLANFPNQRGNELAVTQTREFMMNGDIGSVPYVVKTEILLNAVKFLDRPKLLEDCKKQAEDGHWPEGTNITSLIVHELGHHLTDVIKMMEFGLFDGKEYAGYYITKDNLDAYSRYVTDSLAVNQIIEKRIVEQAYEAWLGAGKEGALEDFCSEISEYASGKQPDGGMSYGETIAEAVAEGYLHGELASDASKAITDCIALRLNNFE